MNFKQNAGKRVVKGMVLLFIVGCKCDNYFWQLKQFELDHRHSMPVRFGGANV